MARRSAFRRGLGRGGDGLGRRRCGVTPRPEDPHPNPLPQGEGAGGGLVGGGGGWTGVGRKARGWSANVGRRGTNGGRASGERRAAIRSGRRRMGSRPRTDGIRRRRGLSSGSRSEAAGIWRSGGEAYPASVHYLRTDGKSGTVGGAGVLRAAGCGRRLRLSRLGWGDGVAWPGLAGIAEWHR